MDPEFTWTDQYGSDTLLDALDSQAFHNPSVLQMLLDYLVNILPINITVPDRFRIHDQDRPFRTSVQATRCIDPDPSLACKSQLLATLLGIVTNTPGTEPLTAVTAILALIGAEKNMISVIRHGSYILSGKSLQDHAILIPCWNVKRLFLTD
jgi:hypothetical protein